MAKEESAMTADKKKAVAAEERRLKKIFDNLPDESKELTKDLIQNAAFMAVTLKELQADVTEHGAMIQCTSGNGFETLKDNPAQKAYATMISRYCTIISQLTDLLPKLEENDELLDFIDRK